MLSYTVRAETASVIIAVWLLAEVALYTRRQGNARAGGDWTFPVLVVAQVVGIDLAYIFARHDLGSIDGGVALLAAGAVVGAAGLVLRVWAIHTLGRFFNFTVVIQEGHRVVTNGPYRLLRHPSYTGMLLTRLGLGLALGTWASIAAVVLIPMPAMVARILVEERALKEALGEEYDEYAARTSRLIPRIW
jgi:protein-S-isoprenylcysteine O-methyltransferase